jgi:hypothetical protein
MTTPSSRPHIENQTLDGIEAGLLRRVEVETAPDLVHQVRGLSFFKRHLAHGVASIGRREGLAAQIDERATPKVFLAWIDGLMAQRAYASIERRDYIIFGAGILLKTLIEEPPIRLTATSGMTERAVANPLADVWPEGFLATSYCLSVLDAVLHQEGLATFVLAPEAHDIGVWQSFRENMSDDPRLAIPFLDVFVGNEPNWSEPTWARNRPAQMQRGRRLLLS